MVVVIHYSVPCWCQWRASLSPLPDMGLSTGPLTTWHLALVSERGPRHQHPSRRRVFLQPRLRSGPPHVCCVAPIGSQCEGPARLQVKEITQVVTSRRQDQGIILEDADHRHSTSLTVRETESKPQCGDILHLRSGKNWKSDSAKGR